MNLQRVASWVNHFLSDFRTVGASLHPPIQPLHKLFIILCIRKAPEDAFETRYSTCSGPLPRQGFQQGTFSVTGMKAPCNVVSAAGEGTVMPGCSVPLCGTGWLL